jgi:protein involved in polysaccharide export with SLBB domain
MSGKGVSRALLSGSFTVLFGVVSILAQNSGRVPQQMQPPPPSAGYRQPSNSPIVLLSSDEDYRIGASDVIEIRIEDAPELSGNLRVAANGTVPMPFLGKILARDKTTEELSKLIANGLRGQYLKDPKVTVAVLQYNSRSFFIQGAVRQPGVYQIEGRPSLLKLITIAGGLAEDHGSTAFIIREIKNKPGSNPANPSRPPTPEVAPAAARSDAAGTASPLQVRDPGPTDGSARTDRPNSAADGAGTNADGAAPEAQYELHTVNINGLLKGNFASNTFIAPGDIINIPRTDVFFVAGEVRSPGSYPLKDGTTLRQAISLAQGLAFNAAGRRGVIFRENQRTGTREEIKVDIGQVMSGKAEDVPILANDIVIVPNSRLKTVGSTLLTAFGVNSARIPIY